MDRIHPECSDSDPSGRSASADILLRQEPDEEEDEEEDEGDSKEDDDDNDKDDDGYSERGCVHLFQWWRMKREPFRQNSRGDPRLTSTRISQSHSKRGCSGGGYAAEPAITAAGGAKAAASGSLPWRAHDQEEHI